MIVLFEPHHDDAALFAAYTLLGLRPTVVTVFGDAQVQDPLWVSRKMRENENLLALSSLGVPEIVSWGHSDLPGRAVAEQVVSDMVRWQWVREPEQVWAPLHEEGGHEQHNMVAAAAQEVFGVRVSSYATYRRGEGRTVTDNEMFPEPGWRSLKMRALSHYPSQIDLESTRPWFTNGWDREWIA